MNPDEFRGNDDSSLFETHHLDLYEEILSYSSFHSYENQLSIQNLKDAITQDKILSPSSDFLTEIDIDNEEQVIQFLINYYYTTFYLIKVFKKLVFTDYSSNFYHNFF